MIRATLAAAAVALCTVGTAGAGSKTHNHATEAHIGMARHGELMIEGAVARASIGSAPNSAAYLTVKTMGAPDRLIGAESDAARKVELHRSYKQDGVMRMEPIEGIPVEPGAPAVLEPGGAHVMLMGLVAPLQAGTEIALTLTFEKAGDVTLSVPVRRRLDGHSH